MESETGQLQSNQKELIKSVCSLFKSPVLTVWKLSLLSTFFSTQTVVNPTEGPLSHLDSDLLRTLRQQTKGGYYYFVAELQGGSSPSSAARELSAEFVSQKGPGNRYIFRKSKPVNVTNVMIRDQILNEYRLTRLGTPTQSDSLIKDLDLYPREQHSTSLVRRDSSNDELYYTTVKKLGFKDPGFKNQWHLLNKHNPKRDLNVANVWLEGITGAGITVSVVDSGVNYEHEDLKDNYLAEGSYDFNEDNADPRPKLEKDTHGTPCAGIIAAKPNDVCGVGVAYGAKFSAIRLISKPHSSEVVAKALQYRNDINDIYSCSWGLEQDQKHVDTLSEVVKEAFTSSTKSGRKGKGNIYVFSAGNGAEEKDNCSFNIYSNLIETITVGAIDHDDIKSEYSEWCTSLLVSTYSSQDYKSAIYTTSSTSGKCDDRFGGTSAAAPQVSGVIALGLEARPELTWRDVQNVLIQTAVTVQENHSSWETTHPGRPYSPFYGYGKIDAFEFVKMAKSISLLGPHTKYTSPVQKVEKTIPYSEEGLVSSIYVSKEDLEAVNLKNLEHVTVNVVIQHTKVADLFVDLVSPNNIRSALVVSRKNDQSHSGFPNSTFLTLKHWHEPAVGNWSLVVYDLYHPDTQGQLVSWELNLYGEMPTGLTTVEIIIIVSSCIGALLLIAGGIFIYMRFFRKKRH